VNKSHDEIFERCQIETDVFEILFNKYIGKRQFCAFCLDPESMLSIETCCTGCSALKNKEVKEKH
jgi:hypothetical protein